MENLNKVLSFVLGLVIVVVFLAIISGKIDLKKRIPQLAKITAKVTPSPTPTVEPQNLEDDEITHYQNNVSTASTTKGGSPVKTIPATGSPTILIPGLLSALASGLYLKKKS